MNNRIFIVLGLLIIAGCFVSSSIYRPSAGSARVEQPVRVLTEEQPEAAVVEMKDARVFRQFIYDCTQQTNISQTDTAIWATAQLFLPDAEQYNEHLLNLQMLHYTDSVLLVFYEFNQVDLQETNMFLAGFTHFGHLTDLVSLQPVSFDGNLSINMLENNIVELQYFDFLAKTHLRQPLGSTPTKESAFTERRMYDYYRFDGAGRFTSLTKTSFPETDRQFPQASVRLLRQDELSGFSIDDLQMMRYEIYASYGYIFSEEIWADYFSEKAWYEGRVHHIEAQLSEVERINLKQIMALESAF